MKSRFNESNSKRKIVNEGAGAGYTVTIKGLRFGKILDKKITDVEGDPFGCYECKVEILPGEYEIDAEDYYNDFFWQEHEFGETPRAQIDGGVATVVYSKQWEDDEQSEQDLRDQVENQELDITFDYGHGWIHVDLPREKIVADHINVKNSEYYAGIMDIELNAPDLADAVNAGYQSIYDRDEEEPEEDENFNESAQRKINLTWDEYNKLCDLIDMDWKRWNKSDPDNINIVANRALEHLEWVTSTKLGTNNPKDVRISFTIPSALPDDEFSTGRQQSMTIYELIDGMYWG